MIRSISKYKNREGGKDVVLRREEVGKNRRETPEVI